MSCSFHDAVLRLDAPELPVAERAAAAQHLEGCAECGASLALLARARDLLGGYSPEPLPGVMERLIAPRAPAPRRGWLLYYGAGAAVAAALLIALWPSPAAQLVAGSAEAGGRRVHPGDVLPVGVELALAAGSRVELALGELEVASGARLTLARAAADAVELRLAGGRIEARVEPLSGSRSFRVLTAQALVEVVGTVFRVTTDGATTRLEVDEGRVRFTPAGEAPLSIGPGEQALAPVPAAPEPAMLPKAPLPAPRSVVPEVPAPSVEPAADPRDAEEAHALMLRADAARRARHLPEAIQWYGEVAAHPAGRMYAEEALLRRALLLREQGAGGGAALAALAEADARYPRGALGAERVALAAELHLDAGMPDRAADVLEAADIQGRAVSLLEMRLRVATALAASAPERVEPLVRPLAAPGVPPGLQRAAASLLARVQAAPKKE
jgi:ferric-dicitrate binding protein FerR (iron transport regulator)